MALSTRDNILAVTAKIIEQKGLEAASIRNVCEKAGVKAPTIYYYFQDKEGLISAVVAKAYEKYGRTHREFVNIKSPLKGIVQSWDVFFKFVEDNTELFHAIVHAHLTQNIPKEGYELFGSIQELFKNLEDKKKLKLPAGTSAQIFYATAYGLALVYVSQAKSLKLTKNIRLTRDLCIRGLLV